MMLIPCPECGLRNENEFHYGGQAHVAYPADGGTSLSDAQWAEYLFFRNNPKGPFAERWMHSAGCRRWFNAIRDTVTYQFLAVYRVGEPRPEPNAVILGHSGIAADDTVDDLKIRTTT